MGWPTFGNNTEARRAEDSKKTKPKEEKKEDSSTYKTADYYSGKGFKESTDKALKEAGAD